MEANRLQTRLGDIESRVEELRQQAISIQNERESLLELLQTMQDNTDRATLSDADRDDFEWQLERLIIRCLTVDVSVQTPRNEIQEDAFKKIADILDKLKADVKKNPIESEKCVESYLNASLSDPLSGNINQKFQEKLLSCTIDDQKVFRRKLQRMYSEIKKCTSSDVNHEVEETNTGTADQNTNDNQCNGYDTNDSDVFIVSSGDSVIEQTHTHDSTVTMTEHTDN